MTSYYGFVRVSGDFAIPPIYEHVTQFEEGRARYVVRGKVGFLAQDGREAIAARFGDAGPYREGFAAVVEWDYDLHGKDVSREQAGAVLQANRPLGYIDKAGDCAIPPAFIHGQAFSGGLAAVEHEVGRYGFVDTAGNISPVDAKWVVSFCEGRARFAAADARKGFYDSQLRVVIPPSYRQAFDFCEGIARVREERGDERSHFLNPDGDRVLTFEGPCDEEFSNGLLAARQGAHWGYINKGGEWVIPPAYTTRPATFNEGFATVAVDDRYGFINTQGDVAVEPQYESLYPISGGLAAVYVNGLWGFLNAAGDMVIDPQFAEPGIFSEGLCGVGVAAGAASRAG